MNLEEMRKRVGEISAQLVAFKEVEITDEVVTEINELNGEFTSLKNKIEALEKIEAVSASANTSVRKVEAKSVTKVVTAGEPKSVKNYGFKNAGEFFTTLAKNKNDRRFTNAHQEKFGIEDGAILIPETFISEIQEKVMGDDSLLVKTRSFSVSGNHLSLPVNEVAPWDGTGIQATWTGEGQKHTESKGKLSETNFRLHKLTSLIKVTDELLSDAPALQSFLIREAGDAFVYKVNDAIINGTGAGMPQGILNSGFTKTIAKEVGQAADSIVYENLIKMYSSLLPASRKRAMWIYNPQCEEQLRNVAFKSGVASPVPAYMPASGLNVAPYGTLLGLPVMPMMAGVSALGDKGDIMLVDMDYYYSVTKNGLQSSQSAHVFFDQDIQAFKFIMRLDGKCPYKSPVKTEKGDFEMSGFVTLEERA